MKNKGFGMFFFREIVYEIFHLFIVLITIGSDIIAVAAGTTGSVVLQGDNLETGAGCGAWLGGDHPPEPGDGPRPHVVVLRAHRHQVLLGQSHSRHRGPGKNVVNEW